MASAMIIDGEALAAKIKSQVRTRIADMAKQSGRPVRLAALLVGATPAGEIYAARQQQICSQVGIEYDCTNLPADISREEMLANIDRLNGDKNVTGIML